MLINDQAKNITQIKSRDIYLKLLKTQQTKPNCIDSWNLRLQLKLSDDDWSYIFTLPKDTICDTKLLELQLKILHRCYATNSTISKWDKSKSEICEICSQKANILHNFVTCTKISSFWREIETKFDTYNIDKVCKLTQKDLIFGRFKQAKYDLLNHALFYAKYFIHKQFIMGTSLNANGFINYYKYVLMIEKQRCVEKNKLTEFNYRFGNCTLVEELSK